MRIENTFGIEAKAPAIITFDSERCLINELRRQGKAVIMISSEMPEVLGMSDRIMILHEGRKKGELGRDEATQEKIMDKILS